jgi:hypothetical protein
MHTKSPTTERGLFLGVKQSLDRAFFAKPSSYNLCSTETAKKLAEGERSDIDFVILVEDIWKQIVTNWVEGECQWRGEHNWRWSLCKDVPGETTCAEATLNRTLAKTLHAAHDHLFWANEIPTGSGLAVEGREPGILDFAHFAAPDRVAMIELKIGTDNPVAAAFQLLIYGLFLQLARLAHRRLIHKATTNPVAEPWLQAKHIDLRIVAPTVFYAEYRSLRWFEDRLNAGIAAFGARQRLEMNFAFRRFDNPPQNGAEFIEALKSPVAWA